jgi:hypothetical protein
VGIQGNKIGTSKQIDAVKTVIKLATKIGSDLEHPCYLVDENVLARFTIMTDIIRSLDRDEIEDAAKVLRVSATEKASRSDNIKWATW